LYIPDAANVAIVNVKVDVSRKVARSVFTSFPLVEGNIELMLH